MRNPFVWATFILVCGNEISPHVTGVVLLFCTFVGVSFYVIACTTSLHRPSGPGPSFFLFASALILFSSITFSKWLLDDSNSQHISIYCGSKKPHLFYIQARVRSLEVRGDKMSVTLDRLVSGREKDPFPLSGRLRTKYDILDGLFDPHIVRPGSTVELSGYLNPLPEKSNPFDFDEASYLRSLGIDCLLKPLGRVHLVAGEPFPSRFFGDPSTSLIRFRDKLTRHLLAIHRSVAARQLMPAMLLGQRFLIERNVRDEFRVSGLSHLLAISGLHVGVIGYSFYWLAGLYLAKLRFPLRLQRFVRAVLSITLLLVFATLTGGSASVVRASFMGSLLILGSSVERASSGINSLGMAAFLLLSIDPFLIYTPGFQLSFIAVGTILMLGSFSDTRIVQRIKHPAVVSLLSLLRISFWIFCTTFPVISFHFGSVPSGGILINLAAIPLASFLMISGLVSTLFSFLGLPLWSAFVAATDLFSDLMLALAHHSASLFHSPFLSFFELKSVPGRLSAVGFAPSFLFLFSRMRRVVLRNKVCWSVLVIVLLMEIDQAVPPGASITFLDVGQGDASVVRSEEGLCLAIDTGPGYRSADTVIRHTKASGCSILDPVIISHPHADHIGGLERMIKSGIVGSVFVAFQLENAEQGLGWRKAARENDILIRHVSAGDDYAVGKSLKLFILSPTENHSDETSANNSSIVVLLRTSRASVLFTGDSEKMQERILVSRYGELLSSDVVKVAHHGSRTSSTTSFVGRVAKSDTTVAVISAGAGNRFRHPSGQIVKRWARSRSHVLITAKNGAIRFYLENGRVFLLNQNVLH